MKKQLKRLFKTFVGEMVLMVIFFNGIFTFCLISNQNSVLLILGIACSFKCNVADREEVKKVAQKTR